MSKHTVGPWRVSTKGKSIQYYVPGSQDVNPKWKKVKGTPENLRLMALAPEMLSTLEYALHHLQVLQVKGVSLLITDIQAIISESEGA